jgi:DNA-binding response OmpR family regulator
VKKILIVEDDREISMLEADYLEISGFSVELAFDGAEGLRLALENEYDLLLLDLMLPGVDGFGICKTVRREKDIPILMVTAREDSIDKIRGLGLGADDYIVKPFDPAELVARVTAHLNRYDRLTGLRAGAGADAAAQTETREQWVDFDRLRIGMQSRRVLVEDADIRLTNKEFELLSFLATNPNIVFSKDHLFVGSWGLDAAGDTATVTVHINRIREKIEADPSHPQIIHTVWGAGYRFGRA